MHRYFDLLFGKNMDDLLNLFADDIDVLMVSVYDRTGSLLVAVLMHASYIFSTLFVLAPPTTGVPFLTYIGVFAVALWIVVAAVVLASSGQLSRRPLQRRLA